MNKVYSRIDWENYPSEKTPLNEQNLNKIDVATDEIDNRVIALDTNKFNKTDAEGLFKDVSLNPANGVITFTLVSGATKTIDTLLEKIAINFDYDAETQQLIITLDDGEIKYVDLSALITQYEFLDSDTIAFQVKADGKVTAIVKEGSIEEKHLRPNYLADIKIEYEKAKTEAENAKNQKDLATMEANRAKTEADKAAQYSQIVAPEFYVDLDTMALYKKGGVGVSFIADDNDILYWKII